MRIDSVCATIFYLSLVGCAPSHRQWVDGLNMFIGTRFESNIYEGCETGCGNSYWSPVNSDKKVDKIIGEGGGKRYYITWVAGCSYSLYVSADGVVRSWRYETKYPGSCYVF